MILSQVLDRSGHELLDPLKADGTLDEEVNKLFFALHLQIVNTIVCTLYSTLFHVCTYICESDPQSCKIFQFFKV